MKIRQIFLNSAFLVCVSITQLHAQEDNFDDGNAAGWTELDPIKTAGAGTVMTFSVTDGKYRLKAIASPAPGAVGPARGGALRQDVIYKNSFYLSVDIPAYDAGMEQAFGLLALIQPNPSPGTTDGYSFTYQPVTNDIQISRLEDEAPIEASADIDLAAPLNPAKTHRLVFFSNNGFMEGRIYELDDLTTPLAVGTVYDVNYTSGTCGLVISDNSGGPGQADATFDNYIANDRTLPLPELVPQEDGEYQIRYPDWLVDVVVERTETLAVGDWELVPVEGIARADGKYVIFGEYGFKPARYFRLRRP